MKAIIDGKRYNTATAKLIFDWDNGRPYTDFGHREKNLYRTKKGKIFIHHGGGPLTDMAVSDGSNNGRTGSQSIEPISDKDAFRFLCSHDGEEEAETLFPDMIEDA